VGTGSKRMNSLLSGDLFRVVKLFYVILVMVNFMCQFNWASGCLAIASNITPDMSTRVIWKRLTSKSVD
jgi:hypothetical protein